MVDRAWGISVFGDELSCEELKRQDFQAQHVPSYRWGRVRQGVESSEWLERHPRSALYTPGTKLGARFSASRLCGRAGGVSRSFKSGGGLPLSLMLVKSFCVHLYACLCFGALGKLCSLLASVTSSVKWE